MKLIFLGGNKMLLFKKSATFFVLFILIYGQEALSVPEVCELKVKNKIGAITKAVNSLVKNNKLSVIIYALAIQKIESNVGNNIGYAGGLSHSKPNYIPSNLYFFNKFSKLFNLNKGNKLSKHNSSETELNVFNQFIICASKRNGGDGGAIGPAQILPATYLDLIGHEKKYEINKYSRGKIKSASIVINGFNIPILHRDMSFSKEERDNAVDLFVKFYNPHFISVYNGEVNLNSEANLCFDNYSKEVPTNIKIQINRMCAAYMLFVDDLKKNSVSVEDFYSYARKNNWFFKKYNIEYPNPFNFKHSLMITMMLLDNYDFNTRSPNESVRKYFSGPNSKGWTKESKNYVRMVNDFATKIKKIFGKKKTFTIKDVTKIINLKRNNT